MPMEVTLKGIEKIFGESWALKSVNVDFKSHERISIVGHNGAGKSTLLSIVATIMSPSHGQVLFEHSGEQLSERTDIRRRMSMLSHAPMMYPDLTGFENLRFFAGLYGADDDAKNLTQCLAKVGMAAAANTLFRACSRGMQQRLSFARALLANPELLLLDEPFSGLDTKGTERLKRILMDDFRGGWLLVTHDLGQGFELADRFWILRRGQVEHDVPKSDIDFKEYVRLCEASLPEDVLR